MADTEVFDGEQVKVIRTEPLSLEKKVADIVDQTEEGLALFEERVRVAKKQLGIALRLAQPGQIMAYGEGDKQSIYLTGGAADRILRVGFGFRWSNKAVQIHRDGEGVTAIATGDLVRADGTLYESFTGVRRMVFNSERKGGVEGYIKTEPDLIKAALQNMKHTAVHDLLGLRFLSPADLRDLGLDLDKLERRVEFQDHGEDDGTAPVVPFGKNKGRPITELNDKSLAWYVEAAQKNIADPAKAKWRAKEEKWLKALLDEQHRRAGGSTQPQESSSQGEHDYGPPPYDEREPGADG